IVALLVLEHQVRMQNLITVANYETRYALNPEMARTGSADWPQQRIANAGERLLQYLLFRNEAPLAGAVKGERGFSAEFQNAGPRHKLTLALESFCPPTKCEVFGPEARKFRKKDRKMGTGKSETSGSALGGSGTK